MCINLKRLALIGALSDRILSACERACKTEKKMFGAHRQGISSALAG